MTTGTTLFTRSLRMLGVLATGAVPTANQLADGLTAINGMLESWRNDKRMVYAAVDSTLTMIISQQSYAIGAAGALAITRPTQFDDAYMRQAGTDTPVRLIGQSEWDAIPTKTVTSPIVEKAFYNPTMASSQGTLLVYPVPSAANDLHLISWIVLASLAAMTDTVLLPPGYDRAIASNLAIEIAPEYPGTTVTPELAIIARDSLMQIKRMNSRSIIAVTDIPLATSRRRSNILVGP